MERTDMTTMQIEVMRSGAKWVAGRDRLDGTREYLTELGCRSPRMGVRRGEAEEYDTEGQAQAAVARYLSEPSYQERLDRDSRRIDRIAHPRTR